jgi:hypothetical protein
MPRQHDQINQLISVQKKKIKMGHGFGVTAFRTLFLAWPHILVLARRSFGSPQFTAGLAQEQPDPK